MISLRPCFYMRCKKRNNDGVETMSRMVHVTFVVFSVGLLFVLSQVPGFAQTSSSTGARSATETSPTSIHPGSMRIHSQTAALDFKSRWIYRHGRKFQIWDTRSFEFHLAASAAPSFCSARGLRLRPLRKRQNGHSWRLRNLLPRAERYGNAPDVCTGFLGARRIIENLG